jgi:hypothetical protein
MLLPIPDLYFVLFFINPTTVFEKDLYLFSIDKEITAFISIINFKNE